MVQMCYAAPGRVADTLGTGLVEPARAGVVAFRPLRFRNLWVVQNRSHVRGIVDGRVGWTGGFGVYDK